MDVQKEIGEMLSLKKTAHERVGRELDRIVTNHPIILDAQGNPTEGSQERIHQEVFSLFHSYLRMPTMDEQVAVHNLGENTMKGTSLSVASLLGLTVFAPISQLTPMVAHVAPQAFSHLLAFTNLSGEVGVDLFEGFVTDVCGSINLKVTDAQGLPVVMGEELEQQKLQEVQKMLMWMITQGAKMEIFDVSENSFKFTDAGQRLLLHIIALNRWSAHVQDLVGSQGKIEIAN